MKYKSTEERILEAVSNNGTTFTEFCTEFADTPDRGDKTGWRDLFQKLEALDNAGYLMIDRDGNNRIQLLVLSASGIARLKELRDKAF